MNIKGITVLKTEKKTVYVGLKCGEYYVDTDWDGGIIDSSLQNEIELPITTVILDIPEGIIVKKFANIDKVDEAIEITENNYEKLYALLEWSKGL